MITKTTDLTDLSVQKLEALRLGLDSISTPTLVESGLLGTWEGLRYQVIKTRDELQKSIDDAAIQARKDDAFEERRRGMMASARTETEKVENLGYNSLADPDLDQMPL